MIKKTTLLLSIILTLSSCDPNRVFEENVDLEEAIWTVDNTPQFQFNIDDVSNSYNVYLNIRSTASYPFHNLYVKYNLRDSLDSVLSFDVKEYFIFDPKTGEPYGDGLGDLFDNRFPLIEDYRFSSSGRYDVDLQQFMRLDSLPMIVSVGLRVETSTIED